MPKLISPNFSSDMKEVQRLAGEAYFSTGSLMALTDGGAATQDKLCACLEDAAIKAERAALDVRKLCETYMPACTPGRKKKLPNIELAGHLSVNSDHWMHFTLNTLLPHCRFSTPQYLTDTLTALMDDYVINGKRRLPYFSGQTAALIIDEHCDISTRQVFDADNKGWKAIPNALKGRVIEDDDQFSLHVHLLSTRDDTASCHIYVLPACEVGDFFALRYDYPYAFRSL